MSESGVGRSRARGRARQQTTAPAQAQQAARRPESGPGAPAGVPPPAAPGAQEPKAAGRAAHRGRGGTRPDEATIAAGVGGLSLAATGGDNGSGEAGRPGTAGRGVHRGRTEHFEPVVRPSAGATKHGSYGQVVKLASNYFPVDSLPQRSHYQYHVEFKPTVENIRVRKGMLYDHRKMLGNHLFDGMALWAAVKLPNPVTEVYSVNKRDESKVQIQIKFIHEVAARDPIMLQILNIQMRKNFTHMDFKLINRDYYDIQQTVRLDQQRMELIPGFATSIRQHEAKVLMNVELTFKTVRQETVLELMRDIYKKDPRDFRPNCEKALLGSIVMTKYNNKTYRIDEFDWDKNPQCKFTKKDGSEISFIDYMRDTWSLQVRDHTQPMILSKPKARDMKRGDVKTLLLVPEHCVITGLNDDIRADFNTMREIANHTRVEPNARVGQLTRFMQRMNTNKNVVEEMNNWAFKVPNELVNLSGRNLGPEAIIMTADPKSAGTTYDIRTADWSRNVRGMRLLQPVRLGNWVLVYSPRDSNTANEFLQTLRRVCQPMGMEVQQPQIVACQDDRTQTYVTCLRQHLSEKTEMVVVIVPNNKKDRYDGVKKICCIDLGIPSQVIVSRSLSKKNTIMSVATKIAIQMNCKMGGQVWRVAIPFQSAMVIGIDSYHDSAQRNRSVCATVCSMNPFFTKFYSQISFQTPKQEMSDAFVTQLFTAFKHYYQLNGKLPTPLLFYRDGVGDGQLAQVREWEIKQIHEAISRLNQADYKPKIAFIVVNKRINTRFFQYVNQNSFDNPMSGTVVDDVVTRPERYDFFLVSQSVRQGTVAPTQYNVIHDTTALDADKMQRLTYKLTHLYYNWQGTIRVPAPCQYAHKLAFLVGQSLHVAPSERLADYLYYL